MGFLIKQKKRAISQFICFLKSYVENVGHELDLEKWAHLSWWEQEQRYRGRTHMCVRKSQYEGWRTWGCVGKLGRKIMAFFISILGEKWCYLIFIYSIWLNLSGIRRRYIGNIKKSYYQNLIWSLVPCTSYSFVLSQNSILFWKENKFFTNNLETWVQGF